MVRLYGAEGAAERLVRLRCVWISHIHADHHVGVVTVLAKRRELLRRASGSRRNRRSSSDRNPSTISRRVRRRGTPRVRIRGLSRRARRGAGPSGTATRRSRDATIPGSGINKRSGIRGFDWGGARRRSRRVRRVGIGEARRRSRRPLRASVRRLARVRTRPRRRRCARAGVEDCVLGDTRPCESVTTLVATPPC